MSVHGLRLRVSVAWLAAALLCITAGEARAQYRLDHFTTSNGLPQNTISSIAQTRDGYLWFGTYDGLVRYDGVRFTIFDKGNTPAIRSNQILTLCEDAHGTLWVGTGEGGVIRYRDGVFRSFTTAEGLPDDHVARIEDTPQGLLVFMRGVPHRWSGDKAVPLDPVVLNEFVDRSGATWTRHPDRFSRKAGSKATSFSVALTRDEFRNRHVDSSGATWFRTQKDGVYRIAGDRLERYDAAQGLPAAEWTRGAATDRTGTTWIAGITAVARFKDGRVVVSSSQDMLGSNQIRAIFADREGTVWIGTNENGLFRVTRSFLTSYGAEQGMHGKAVYPIFEARDGRLWFGSANGITRLEQGTFRQHALAKPGEGSRVRLGAAGASLPTVGARSFWEDRHGRMWVGINGGLLSIENDVVTDQSALVQNIGVDAIYQDRAGRLWAGTPRGLFRIDGRDVTFFPDADFLPGSGVTIIHEDREGRIWVGTRGGLARYENNRFVAITTKDGLAGDRIRSIYEDADGVMWIGTFDSGLSRIEKGQITNYTTATGLFNNGVFQILEDSRGHFWMSCNRGIYRIGKQQLTDVARGAAQRVSSVAYGSQDGMLSSEANGGRQPAGVKSRDGRLWFPTQNGVVAIDPAAESYNTEPPPIVIESVVVDGAPASFAGGIRMEPGQRDLEITYTAPSSIKAEHITFKYRLEGLNPRWIDAGTRRTVHYSYLPKGDYTFTVIAANSDGVWNEKGIAIPVQIQPYFYQTRWFVGLLVVMFLAVGPSVYALRVRQLKTREHHLTGLVAQRTTELQSANDRLQQLATLDGLTNIANHRRFKEFLGQEWQRTQRTRTPLSLLMLDVDFFKFYNDSYGHQAGDECLKRVAVALAETVQRGTDLAARYGGEEFAVVLTDTGTEGAALVAETIRARVEAMQIPHSASKVHKFVTVSIGVATRVGDPDVGPDGLITAADAALYKAKRQGRNRIVVESEERSVSC